MNITIVIPVYREPIPREWVSLHQCCRILARYEMVLVCPEDMDTSAFQRVWKSYHLPLKEERFAPAYFKGIVGYNRLCLSEDFYQRFADKDYILIYQPDCYVFADQLQEWCAYGYDFVGAPLVGKAKEQTYSPKRRKRVGNGGFCLRRVKAYLDFFDSEKPLFDLQHIMRSPYLWKRTHWQFMVRLLPYWLRKSTPRQVANGWNGNEDDFWSGLLDLSRFTMRKPTPEQAALFSLERFPKYLAEKGKLPFGCHAWHRWGNYEDFWKQFIPSEENRHL